jgi:hypothetical protein
MIYLDDPLLNVPHSNKSIYLNVPLFWLNVLREGGDIEFFVWTVKELMNALPKFFRDVS